MSKVNTVEEYYEVFKKFATSQGLIFNPDPGIVLPLVTGLFTNKQRYGYPSCPCRLACGEQEHDKDIICPCDYAAADIEQYGKCYCELYVSRDYAEEDMKDARVPERRPAEKMCF